MREIIEPLVILAFLSIFWIIPIFMLRSVLQSMPPGYSHIILTILFFLGWYSLVGWVTIKILSSLIHKLRGRMVFQTESAIVQAKILRRRVEVHEAQYNDTVYYRLQVEFNPFLAQASSGNQQFEISICEKLYRKLAQAESVAVTYAVRDPHIFIIDGE